MSWNGAFHCLLVAPFLLCVVCFDRRWNALRGLMSHGYRNTYWKWVHSHWSIAKGLILCKLSNSLDLLKLKNNMFLCWTVKSCRLWIEIGLARVEFVFNWYGVHLALAFLCNLWQIIRDVYGVPEVLTRWDVGPSPAMEPGIEYQS